MGTYLMLNQKKMVSAERYQEARPKHRKEMAHTPGTDLFSTPLPGLDALAPCECRTECSGHQDQSDGDPAVIDEVQQQPEVDEWDNGEQK